MYVAPDDGRDEHSDVNFIECYGASDDNPGIALADRPLLEPRKPNCRAAHFHLVCAQPLDGCPLKPSLIRVYEANCAVRDVCVVRSDL